MDSTEVVSALFDTCWLMISESSITHRIVLSMLEDSTTVTLALSTNYWLSGSAMLIT